MAKTVTKTVAPTVMKTAEEKPKDIRKMVRELVEMAESAWFKFSVAIAEVYDGELYKNWGFEKFKDYVEAELPIEYRIATWRVQMGQTINKLGIKEAHVAKLGWTKFKELCGVLSEGMTTNQVRGYLEAIKDMSFREVQDFVKSTKISQSGGELVKTTMLTFKCTDEQAEVINTALEMAKELAQTDNDNIALEVICQDWALNRKPGQTKQIVEAIVKKEHKAPTKAKHKEHANKKADKKSATKAEPKKTSTPKDPAPAKKKVKAVKKEKADPGVETSEAEAGTPDLFES